MGPFGCGGLNLEPMSFFRTLIIGKPRKHPSLLCSIATFSVGSKYKIWSAYILKGRAAEGGGGG